MPHPHPTCTCEICGLSKSECLHYNPTREDAAFFRRVVLPTLKLAPDAAEKTMRMLFGAAQEPTR